MEKNNQMRVIAFFIGHKIDLHGISREKSLRSYKRSAGKDNIIFEINHEQQQQQQYNQKDKFSVLNSTQTKVITKMFTLHLNN